MDSEEAETGNNVKYLCSKGGPMGARNIADLYINSN